MVWFHVWSIEPFNSVPECWTLNRPTSLWSTPSELVYVYCSAFCAALAGRVISFCESSIPAATPVNGTIQLELLQAFSMQRQLPMSYILISLDLGNYKVLWLPCQRHGAYLWNYFGQGTYTALPLSNAASLSLWHFVFLVVVDWLQIIQNRKPTV
jgi:hypothetical protein